MPLDGIVGQTLGGMLRFAGQVVFEFVVELLIQGLGHVVIRTVRPGSDPGPTASFFVGLLCWAALLYGGYLLFRAALG